MSRLKKYAYAFEWKHGKTASIITSFKVMTPRSRQFVSMASGPSVTVYDMVTVEPFVVIGRFPLQHMDAIVQEIKREREVLNAIRD